MILTLPINIGRDGLVTAVAEVLDEPLRAVWLARAELAAQAEQSFKVTRELAIDFGVRVLPGYARVRA